MSRTESQIYRWLRRWNDVRSVYRAGETGSVKPLVRRAGWKVWGRAMGRLGSRWFR